MPLWIFFGATALLLLLHGNRLVFTNDEGIILDAAQRMLRGERLYADFFGYMTPGAYWLQQLAFQIAGVSIYSARLPVILGFAGQCALLFAITHRLTSRAVAWIATVVFFVLQLTTPGLITAQHRWDSSTLALASTLCVIMARPWLVALGGFLAFYAVICTPSLGLVGLVTAAWLFSRAETRRLTGSYAAGAGACAVLCLAWLAITDELQGFFAQIAWLRTNYSDVNVMPYGSIISGYSTLFEGASGFEWLVRGGLVACLALPAILPILSTVGWAGPLLLRKTYIYDKPEIIYLLAVQTALVISAYPRLDVMHLAFVAALPYALSAAWAARVAPRWLAAPATMILAVFTGLYALHYVAGSLAEKRVATPFGVVRTSPETATALSKLLAFVSPGDTAFVHPYMPLLYFVTQTKNPTPFSFLAPGMMTAREEAQALERLQVSPPKWVLHLAVAREDFLRVFPAATSLNHRFERLEQWIQAHYEAAPENVRVAGYLLMRRRTQSEQQQSDLRVLRHDH